RPQCRHMGLALLWQPPTEDIPLLGDAAQLEQMIHNVLGNAVEAAGPGGSVTVALRWEEQSRTCVLEVSDSGPGPAPAVAEPPFEPFVSGKPEGVGLGLAVARQVAAAHGGSITWRREGTQTVFRIELPCTEQESA